MSRLQSIEEHYDDFCLLVLETEYVGEHSGRSLWRYNMGAS